MALQIEIPPQLFDELGKQIRDVYAKSMQEAKRDSGVIREFLSISEASELMGVSKNTFNANWIEQGLNTFKVGSRVYVKKKDLYQFVEKHKV